MSYDRTYKKQTKRDYYFISFGTRDSLETKLSLLNHAKNIYVVCTAPKFTNQNWRKIGQRVYEL